MKKEEAALKQKLALEAEEQKKIQEVSVIFPEMQEVKSV